MHLIMNNCIVTVIVIFPTHFFPATTTTTNYVDALASRIEVLVASIKSRSQRLYKDKEGNKGRARIHRKIREEKGILTSVVEKYNRMVPNTATLCLETILSGETAWPWQLPHSGMYTSLLTIIIHTDTLPTMPQMSICNPI